MKTIQRVLQTAVRILDEAKGIVEYVASDETLDSYREVIRVAGWRFNFFKKNAPFVDSHDYWSIEKLLGKVVETKLEKKSLVETVQWALDVPEARLAQVGWKMTKAGYLRAVSVGFRPVKAVSRWDTNRQEYDSQLLELGYTEQNGPRVIYVEQEQLELSACILGANPNALAKAYKQDVLAEADIDFLSREIANRETSRNAADDPADTARARQRAREEFLREFQKKIES